MTTKAAAPTHLPKFAELTHVFPGTLKKESNKVIRSIGDVMAQKMLQIPMTAPHLPQDHHCCQSDGGQIYSQDQYLHRNG